MKTTILYNKNLKWWWLSDKGIIILPSDELLNKYNLIPPVNRDNIINNIESGVLWWNDFGSCYTGKNLLLGRFVTRVISRDKTYIFDYNKYDEKFIENCVKFIKNEGHKMFGYIVVDTFDDGVGEIVLVRCNKKEIEL